MRGLIKNVSNGVCLALVLPAALSCGFGRIAAVYSFWAQFFALVPGLPGDYVRIAYYHLTLKACPLNSRIQFGSYFVHPETRVGREVYIGAYCVLGKTEIGDRSHIASGVQILSGRKQHRRDESGRIQGADLAAFETIKLGADCWVGAGAIVMAGLGARSTVGAGAVAVHPVPEGATVAGVPARELENDGGGLKPAAG